MATGGRRAKEVEIVTGMARKLAQDVARLKRLAEAEPPKTFLHYRAVRDAYHEIQGLIAAVQERTPAVAEDLPEGFAQWLVRNKLNALAAFTRISDSFFAHIPETLTQSLGAWDILSDEKATFEEVLAYFDTMLMEAGIDDQTAEALDATRQLIETVITRLDELLKNAPARLEDFG